MGRASKNSWAIMKGVFSGSVEEGMVSVGGVTERGDWWEVWKESQHTVGDGLDGLCPDDGNVAVLAMTMIANLRLAHSGVLAAQQILLGHSELRTGFDHVNSIDALSHLWEVLYRLMLHD